MASIVQRGSSYSVVYYKKWHSKTKVGGVFVLKQF